MYEGACETGSQIPRALAPGIWHTVRTECIVTTNPDRSVLITIITWHFQFRPMNVNTLHLKYECRARSESRVACYSHCYVTLCPLTTGTVASQFPSSRDAALVTRYLTPHVGVFKFVKTMLLLTPTIAGISTKRCQWFPLRVWWHALALVTHEISWHRAYVT